MRPSPFVPLILAAAALALCGRPARGQGIVPESASGGIAASSSIAFSHTVVSASNVYLVVGVAVRSSGITVASVSYGGMALQPIVAAFAGGYCRAELWGLKGPPVGPHDVQVTLSGSNSAATAGSISYAGVDQVTPIGGSASNYGIRGDVSLTIASVAGDRVVDCMCAGAASAPTGAPAASQTERWKLSSGSLLAGGSDRAGTPGVTMNWTVSQPAGLGWSIGGLTLKPALVTDAGVPDAPSTDMAMPPPDTGVPDAPSPTDTAVLDTTAVDVTLGADSPPGSDSATSSPDAGLPLDSPPGGADTGVPGSDATTDAHPSGDGSVPSDIHAQIGCACTVSGRSTPSLAWLALPLWVLLMRRRLRS